MQQISLYDRFGRPIRNLRISVTPHCNLNCIYCHREGIYSMYHCYKEKDKKKGLLSPSQIRTIVLIAVKYGIREVKLTGGEPLLRRDIVEIVEKISEISEIKDISIVTNGHLLEKFAESLKSAGLNRVNVSLPSLSSEKYSYITRYPRDDGVEKIIRGIKKAIEANLNPVKINVVILKGLNDNEIPKFISLAQQLGAVLQLIELQDPNGFNSGFFKKYYYPLKPLEESLEKKAKKIIVREMHNRKRFIMDDGAEVEIVRPMFNYDFCMHCNRLRVTFNGEFKPCLMRDDNHVDFSTVLDKPDELEKKIIEAVIRREPYFKTGDSECQI